MKNAITDNLHERYTEVALMFLNVSGYFDWKFKLPYYLSDEEKTPLLKHLNQEAQESIVVKKKLMMKYLSDSQNSVRNAFVTYPSSVPKP